MSSKIARGIVWLAALIALYAVVPFEVVFEALLQFGAAGVVPGTGIELTPGQTVLVLVSIGVIALTLLFRAEIVRLLQRRKQAAVPLADAPQPMLPSVRIAPSRLSKLKRRLQKPTRPAPVVVVRIAGKPGLAQRVMSAVASSMWVRIAFAWASYGLRLAWYYLRRAASFVYTHLRRLTVYSIRTFQMYGRKARRLTIIHWRLALYFAGVYWRRTKLYLQRFDARLEQQFKQSEVGRLCFKLVREAGTVLAVWRRQCSNVLARLTTKG